MTKTILSTLAWAGNLLLAGLLSSGVSHAELIVSPTAVLQNELGLWRPSNEITNAIDQSGLSASFVSGVTDLDTYLAGNPTHQAVVDSTFFVSSPGQTVGNVDFDLGAVYEITQFVFWQQTFFWPEQIRTFSIYTSNDPAFTTLHHAGDFTATILAQNSLATAQEFSLTPSQAQYVRLRVLTNNNSNYSDLGELAFGVLPVPEPSGWILLTGALAGLGLVGRRRTGRKRS